MGRPRSEVEIKQISLKMPEELYKRLLEVAYQDARAQYPKDLNLSEWIRGQLADLADLLAEEHGGREKVSEAYKQAKAAELRTALADLEL